MKRVVITGMGTINPLGNNVADFWDGIQANKLGFNYVHFPEGDRIAVKIAAEVKDFNPEDYIDKKEAKRMDRFTQFAVAAASQAMKDAGTDFKDVDPYRSGVIIGAGIGGLELTQKEHLKYLEKGPDKISVF